MLGMQNIIDKNKMIVHIVDNWERRSFKCMTGQTINATLSLMMTATVTAGLDWQQICMHVVADETTCQNGCWLNPACASYSQLTTVIPVTDSNFSLQHGHQQLFARTIRSCIRVVAGQSVHSDGGHGLFGVRHVHVV
jgi:hypothetical protein